MPGDRGGASLRSQDVILTLSRLLRLYGNAVYFRSSNGAEFAVAKVMRWLRNPSIRPAFIAPGSRWQSCYNEQRPRSAHHYQPPAEVRRNCIETTTIEPKLTT